MKSMNRKENKKIAVMAALIMGFMVIVTPSSGIAGLVDSYDALVTTTGVTSIEITIPAGFIAVEPAIGGVQIARMDFWNESKGDYYGYATITSNNANPTEMVDVYAKMQVGGDEFEYGPTPLEVDYTPGTFTSLNVTVNDGIVWVNTTLPTETEDGCITITADSLSLDLLEDVSINIGEFVRNPRCLSPCDFAFSADGKIAWVSITVPIGRGAVFRNGMWYADTDGDHQTDIWYRYGIPGDKPAVGDIDNNGVNDIIAYRGGWWYVSREDHTGTNWAKSFVYGIPGDIPVIGDIDNDGTVDAVIFRNGWWYVCNDTHTGTDWAKSFKYGNPDDIPVLADVDNDGSDDVVIFRNGWWYVCNDAHTGTNWDKTFRYGNPNDKPIVDDIRNDGSNDIAILRNGHWYVSTSDFSGTDYHFMYGILGDVPILNKFCSV
jgi:hypothetical protein